MLKKTVLLNIFCFVVSSYCMEQNPSDNKKPLGDQSETNQPSIVVPSVTYNVTAGSIVMNSTHTITVPQAFVNRILHLIKQQPVHTDWNYLEKVNVSFKDVAYINDRTIDMMVKSLKRVLSGEDSFENLPDRGLLLYGQETDKSTLAQAIAGELGIPFIGIDAEQLFQHGRYTAAQMLRQFATKAQALDRYVVLFIDRLDVPGHLNNQEGTNTYYALRSILDHSQNSKLFIIGATDDIDVIDIGLKRSGRLGCVRVSSRNQE